MKPDFDESSGFRIIYLDFKKTHAEILCRIDDFIAELKESEQPFPSWSEALQKFEDLLNDLREHEDHEVKMVQKAFNQSTSKKTET